VGRLVPRGGPQRPAPAPARARGVVGITSQCLPLTPPLHLPPPRKRAEGVKAEAAYAKDKTLPDPNSTTNPEFKIVLSIIKDTLAKVGGVCVFFLCVRACL
jgi:hypothetical protein